MTSSSAYFDNLEAFLEIACLTSYLQNLLKKMAMVSDMSRTVRNMFEFKCGNRQNALKYIEFVFIRFNVYPVQCLSENTFRAEFILAVKHYHHLPVYPVQCLSGSMFIRKHLPDRVYPCGSNLSAYCDSWQIPNPVFGRPPGSRSRRKRGNNWGGPRTRS